MRTVRTSALVALATAALALAASPASAAATAYNTRSVFLDGNPMLSDPDACTSRSISLTAGTYTWSQVIGSVHDPSRDIYLAAGTYTWTDCMRAWDGYYEQKSSLSKPGSAAAVLNDPRELHFTPGTRTFGSLLDPHF
ncbi:hypothetical protein [Streptomyces sp. NPDC095817]|uniref:hypothetical protein n=1 Tax=Streptomyces sp. NPDC095817 TaxID=3155082 RepID=UPI003331F469